MTELNQYKGWSLPPNEKHFQKWLYENRTTDYQETPLEISLDYVVQFKCAIDIGANIGMMTRRYSGIYDKVIAFEPVDINYKCLQNNVDDLDNIKLYKVGLGDEIKQTTIHNDEQYVNCGGWSISDWNNTDWTHYKNDINLITETIDIMTLDSFNLTPDYIKIDTQSYEIQVLRGAEQTIFNSKPIIQIEVEKKKSTEVLNDPIYKLMRKYDYIPLKLIKKDWIFGPRLKRIKI